MGLRSSHQKLSPQRLARWGLAAGLASFGALAALAYIDPLPHARLFGEWSARSLATLTAMLLLPWSAHVLRADPRLAAARFDDLFGREVITTAAIATLNLPALIFRGATAAAALTNLMNDRSVYLNAPKMGGALPPGLIEHPISVFFSMIVGSLGFALVVTLWAIFCNDRASSYPDFHHHRQELLRRAQVMSTAAAYALIWAFAVIPVLADATWGFVSMTFVFAALWSYYFSAGASS
jgi:hypothetical protein